ncbi:hypothetical protein ACHAWC_000448, partial [Mediolabrus comicus]
MDALSQSIVALGSYDALKQTKVIDHVIQLARTATPNVLDLNSDSGGDSSSGSEFTNEISAVFAEKGCSVKQCDNYSNELQNNIKEWADVIIYRHDNDHVDEQTREQLIEAMHKGVVLCALPNILRLLDQAADIIPSGTAIMKASERQMIDNLMMNANKRVIVIDELAAFVIAGGNAMAIGGEGGSTCHVSTRNDAGETITGPLPTTWHEPIPVEEVLQFPVPATSSHLESLEDHVDTNFIIADDVLPKAALLEEKFNDDEGECFPKIVACGRTETLQMQAIVDKVIELSGVDLPKVLYVGTASFDRTDRFNVCTKKFREMG